LLVAGGWLLVASRRRPGGKRTFGKKANFSAFIGYERIAGNIHYKK
jgi:hypothetical protein